METHWHVFSLIIETEKALASLDQADDPQQPWCEYIKDVLEGKVSELRYQAESDMKEKGGFHEGYQSDSESANLSDDSSTATYAELGHESDLDPDQESVRPPESKG